ncbi:MAG: histidinol-phosphate transaminase [Gammaproteobacteria bacterium]|nr:histidinol-phosphate transaminase [Gammaproteobacteria bacterium]
MSTDRIAQYVRPEIQALKAYQVGNADNLIKLDNMENPYDWEEPVKNGWLERVQSASLNRYPDPEASELQKQLRQVMSVPDEVDLLLGNGSDELIQIICMALAKPGATLLSVTPAFVMYKMLAIFTGMKYVGVDLNDDFSLNLELMLSEIEETQPAIVFLAYPNNPTGNLFNEQDVCKIIEASPGLVVIDEAYYAFADASFAKYLSRYENMIVMRTVSKMGLAGLRLGYMMGNPCWINEFNKVRMPFNINCLTQASVEYALENVEMFNKQTQQLCRNRDELYDAMQKMPAIQCYPTKTNFILFRTEVGQAARIFDGIKKAGVLIKNLSVNGGALTDCLRVTIGKEDQNAAFLSALQESL